MIISKAERIRALLKLGHSNKTIAETIGCEATYVRAVRQRTTPDGEPITDPANRAWSQAHPEKVKEYYRARFLRVRNDPKQWRAYLDAQKERKNHRYRIDPEFRERMLEATARYRAKKRQQQVSA